MYVKDKGRFGGLNIYPREGRLFFIVTLDSEAGLAENKSQQLALWIEDAHQLKLGKKEGSLFLNDTKWIQLGKTYTFLGRVSYFSSFDKELRDKNIKDLIVVKIRIKDIEAEMT